MLSFLEGLLPLYSFIQERLIGKAGNGLDTVFMNPSPESSLNTP